MPASATLSLRVAVVSTGPARLSWVVASRNPSLKLLPWIAEGTPKRAAQLGQSVSGLIAILVWNQAQQRLPLKSEQTPPNLVRVVLPCSFRSEVRARIDTLAEEAGMTVNAFVETLLARELKSGSAGLTIVAALGAGRARPP